MTTFDKREEGFEKKFAHDEELRFKANARRNKLLGLWAAEKMGLSGPTADAYAKEVVVAAPNDQQHGPWATAATAVAFASIRAVGSAPIVRVPLGAFAVASRSLDFGAEGIIAPMINTVADAKAFVGAAKFPPLGERS